MRKRVFGFLMFLMAILPMVSLAGGHSNPCRDGKIDPADNVKHHIMDNHDWHITDIPVFWGEKCADGRYSLMPIAVHLPWIVYNSETGLEFFSSHDAESKGYSIAHEHIHYDKNPEATVIDFSITRNVLHMILVMILMVWLFTSIAKTYKQNVGKSPKGKQSLFEPVITFVRDDIAKAYLGEGYKPFTPYLLTLFFFIWFANLLGLTPLSSNIAGNTSFTLALSFLTLILIIANSTKDFWMHILWFPGVPTGIKPLMLIVEGMGLIIKPVALAIRLFANIVAGHFMTLSLISLIFILGKGGESIGGALGIAPLSFAFGLFIFCLENIVAIIQAFVFTLLTAVFISQAMETHDHDAEGAHH